MPTSNRGVDPRECLRRSIGAGAPESAGASEGAASRRSVQPQQPHERRGSVRCRVPRGRVGLHHVAQRAEGFIRIEVVRIEKRLQGNPVHHGSE